MEASGGFLEAKDSARAKMMQLTTISGMKSPRLCDSEGRNASRSSCTMVTNVAMTTI